MIDQPLALMRAFQILRRYRLIDFPPTPTS